MSYFQNTPEELKCINLLGNVYFKSNKEWQIQRAPAKTSTTIDSRFPTYPVYHIFDIYHISNRESVVIMTTIKGTTSATAKAKTRAITARVGMQSATAGRSRAPPSTYDPYTQIQKDMN